MNRTTTVVYEEIVPIVVRRRQLVVIKPCVDSDRDTVCFWKVLPTIERCRLFTTLTRGPLSPISAEDALEEELEENRRLLETEVRLVESQKDKLTLCQAFMAANREARRKYAATKLKMAS